MHYFWISIYACCLLKSTAILVNNLVNKNSFTSCNFSNIICYLIIIHWLIKKASSINNCDLLFLLRVLLYHPYSQMIKQKVYLLPEHLDQLSSLKISFFFYWHFWLIFIPGISFKENLILVASIILHYLGT